MTEILRTPNPWPQTNVLTRTEKEILYWWARWWGKTDAGLARLLYFIDNPKLRALILRESYDDLVDWVDRAMQLYSHFWAVKTGKPVIIKFPSGAEIRTWYLKNESYDKYKWHEYQKIIIEELTQIPWEEQYEKLLWSLRSTVPWLDPQIFCTTNPDWVGRLWVKRRFVDVITPWQKYTDPSWNTRVFISAKITDNPVLMDLDPWYIQYLEWIQDDQLRKAWLEWDWDAYDIKWAIYWSQLKQAREENRICRVPIEKNIPVHTAWDLWMNDSTAIIFFQIFGREVRVIDSYYNSWEDLSHYVKLINDKWYTYWKHYLPHDANIKSLQTWKTTKDYLVWLWLQNCIVLQRTSDLWADVSNARQKFSMCWIDQGRCKTMLEHLELYRKERDDKRQIFKDQPYHWPESHYADSFRYMCNAINLLMINQVKQVKPFTMKMSY
jgi:hypothetical protein